MGSDQVAELSDPITTPSSQRIPIITVTISAGRETEMIPAYVTRPEDLFIGQRVAERGNPIETGKIERLPTDGGPFAVVRMRDYGRPTRAGRHRMIKACNLVTLS